MLYNFRAPDCLESDTESVSLECVTDSSNEDIEVNSIFKYKTENKEIQT